MPSDDHSLERRMRAVLLALALTSNGRTATRDPSSGGDHEPDPIPQIGSHDAPQLHYAAQWDLADEEEALAAADEWYTPRLRREQVLDRAETELSALRHSSRAPSNSESAAELHARIVEHGGSGLTRREVAVLALTSETVVARAWREAGRDEQWGRPVHDARALPRGKR